MENDNVQELKAQALRRRRFPFGFAGGALMLDFRGRVYSNRKGASMALTVFGLDANITLSLTKLELLRLSEVLTSMAQDYGRAEKKVKEEWQKRLTKKTRKK